MEITEQQMLGFYESHFSDGAIEAWQARVAHQCSKGGGTVERYPDGTVRTLTDAQIAFLRRSELRELEHRKAKEASQTLLSKMETSLTETVLEETRAGVPIAACNTWPLASYETLYGTKGNVDLVLQAESALDKAFMQIPQVERLRYWPVAAIR